MIAVVWPRKRWYLLRSTSRQFSWQVFLVSSALLFAGSVALTIRWCGGMQSMRGMPMPGGWTMSMAWMRAPGERWLASGLSFLGMWVTMMVAMMLPALLPMLWRYRQAMIWGGEPHPEGFTVLAALGYVSFWAICGAIVFPLGAALAAVEMRSQDISRIVPFAAGMAVLIAGGFQLTQWKARQLACCRGEPEHGDTGPVRCVAAFRDGLGLGLQCAGCCANLMAILLVFGVMDLRAMAAITLAVTAERLAPAGESIARVIGALAAGFGLYMIANAAGLL
jgi:predicted metal-binding membrane protein